MRPSHSERVRAYDLADRFQVKTDTVLGWYRRGWIPGLKVGKTIIFDVAEVERAIRKRSIRQKGVAQ